ncbi:MAG TPA: response regulator [Candidatus Aquilonibacter sp.]|nr:response regulator [Candidatus Aquilonibacter sp.]
MERERRALAVDDDPAVCELIHTVLTSTGMNVLALGSSDDAIPLLREEKFAVLLFDLRMPEPDGIQLTRQARHSGLNQMTPIIVLSEDQSTKAFSEGFVAGASFFLYKPIDKGRLLSLARAMQGMVEHERRRFRRVALQVRAGLAVDRDEIHGETLDLSLDGMLVQAERSIPAGSVVQVTLHLAPGMRPVVGTGLVMRTLPGNRMGIHIQRIAMADSERLQEFLLPLILKDKPEGAAVHT